MRHPHHRIPAVGNDQSRPAASGFGRRYGPYVVAALLLIVLDMAPRPLLAACTDTKVCAVGEKCVEGTCKLIPVGQACTDDEGCGQGHSCVAQKCTAPRIGTTTVEQVQPNDAPGTILVPQLNVPIPGLTFANDVGAEGKFFAQYVAAAFRYALSIAAVAATIMFVYGAFLYLIGTAIESIRSGKQIMTDAVVGMLLVLGAHLILRTINPATTQSAILSVPQVVGKEWQDEEEGPPPPSTSSTPSVTGGYKLPEPVCDNAATCAQYCNGCASKSSLPDAPGIATAGMLVPIPSIEGLKGSGSVTKEAANALVAAAQAAQHWADGPYELKIVSSFRPLIQQMELACKAICSNKGDGIGKAIARPGGSNHGTGVAVDLELLKDGQSITHCCSVSEQVAKNDEKNVKLLQDIMSSIGWVRYCHEIWHFEWGTDSIPDRSKSCPWPPK